MDIRAADSTDVAAIMSIWNGVIESSTATFTTDLKSEADIAGFVATGRVLVLHSESDNVAGFASFGPFRAGPGYADVAEHTIYLSRAAIGRGHGRRLLERLMDLAASQGVRVFVAGIGGENSQAIRFHEALKFVKVAQMPGVGTKFGRHHDLILMQKNLTTST